MDFQPARTAVWRRSAAPLLCLSLALVLSAHPRALAQGPASGQIVLNEVLYDPPEGGSEAAREWVELLNASDRPASLEGWSLADNRASDALPALELPAGGYLVVAGGEGFAADHPGFAGRLVTLGGSIGNGLGNGGDQLRLIDGDGRVVDGLSWGDDSSQLEPPAPDVAAGHSLERVPAGQDRDLASDWAEQPSPSPGRPAGDLRPTDVPTAAPPPTVPPGARVLVNELLPAPSAVDWDGSGQADADDEWIELFNPGDAVIEIRGWRIDDVAEGGSTPYVIPDGTRIAPRGHLLIFKRDSGLSLNNGGDAVRLLQPDGREVDSFAYTRSAPDTSYARLVDGQLPWTDALPPSPGGPNGDGPGPTPGSGPSPSPVTASPTPEVPPTAPGPVPSSSATPGPRSTPDPDRIHLPLLISEVLFDPTVGGNDAAREWLELHNPGPAPVSLAGWSVGDRSAWDALPALAIPPGGFAVVAASDAAAAALAGSGALILVLSDGRIGGGLANGGDLVRLRGPTGRLVDAVSYGANLDAFDPAVPMGPPGTSIERIPPGLDTDKAGDWWPQPHPSPGRSGTIPAGPPPIRLNEVLPAPRRIDWNGDGIEDHTDEWLELHNPTEHPVELAGWRIENREREGWGHDLPAGTRIAAGGFLLLHRSTTTVALRNQADTIRLIRPDGVEADRFGWTRSPGYDRSWSRSADGAGAWRSDYAVTPGGPNRPMPEDDEDETSNAAPAPPALALGTLDGESGAVEGRTFARLRALPAGRRVTLRGRVTAPPDLLAARSLYVGDEAGGILVYLADREARLPALALGDRVELGGRLKDYHGERELVLASPADIRRLGPGPALAPAEVATGMVAESHEGRLVKVFGRVTAYGGPTLTLDDGSGPARVLVRRATGLRRPWVEKGQWLGVTGIVGQYAEQAPWTGGHRLMPRFEADFADEPSGTAGAKTSRQPHRAQLGAWRPSLGLVTSPGSRADVQRPLPL